MEAIPSAACSTVDMKAVRFSDILRITLQCSQCTLHWHGPAEFQIRAAATVCEDQSLGGLFSAFQVVTGREICISIFCAAFEIKWVEQWDG